MKSHRLSSEINAGSTADIAFLLLIFFLVTTTFPNDNGIIRKLPKPCVSEDCNRTIPERNLLQISLNKENQLRVNQLIIPLDSLSETIKRFIDNNGKMGCTYCKGNQNTSSSDHPKKAIIVLRSDRESHYGSFMRIQNAITSAYSELRSRYAMEVFQKEISTLSEEELKMVRHAYPLLLSEAELK